ncbi:MAG: GNAT family N-acetyltransferase [Cyclobacteriaceae bacterium]|nr:GNAT family N-acetyltransferase [Cyclobacteriaceae bacterium SS2]
MKIEVFKPAHTVGLVQLQQIRDFLYEHLDQYGDKKEDIMKAINYALNKGITPGGFIVVGYEGDQIAGAVVVNKTGMEGYIPENILVYIATHRDQRGKGLGKKLMQRAIDEAEGAIALHVEPDNPAKILYEKLGFTNKYLEMRLIKS